jgi:hypothetical protein
MHPSLGTQNTTRLLQSTGSFRAIQRRDIKLVYLGATAQFYSDSSRMGPRVEAEAGQMSQLAVWYRVPYGIVRILPLYFLINVVAHTDQ